MKGVVHAVDDRSGRVAVRTGELIYTVFELTTLDEVAVGDVMRWKHDDTLGAEDVTNSTRGPTFVVQFLGQRFTESEMKKLLRL